VNVLYNVEAVLSLRFSMSKRPLVLSQRKGTVDTIKKIEISSLHNYGNMIRKYVTKCDLETPVLSKIHVMFLTCFLAAH